jgi:thiol:disulfide interchange protein/DsbC/DsbD-like thiol-disulfide interchange protein
MHSCLFRLLIVLVLGLPWLQAAPLAAAPVRVEAVEVELVARDTALVAGRPARLGLRMRHEPHWHSYWRNPGDSGLPTRLEFELPAGFAAGPIEWPAPQRLFIPPLANYGYEGEIVLPFLLDLPDTARGRVLIKARAFWLMCRDVCIPGEADLRLEITVAPTGAQPARSRHAPLFERADAGAPAGAVDAQVSVEADRLSIGLPERLEAGGRGAAADALQFFPYHETALLHAAPQLLLALEDSSGSAIRRRLELQLSPDGVRQAARGGEDLLAAARGIVVAGDTVFELRPALAAQPLAGGQLLARVEGAPAVQPRSASSSRPALAGQGGDSRAGAVGQGGLLDGLLRSTTGSAAGRSATSVPGSSSPATGAGPGLWLALLLAVAGGLILNLMPCVFPVVGLKVLSFATPGHSPRRSAIVFAAGVVLSFWVLAAALMALRAAGVAAGWGFQLQSPVFVAAMALLFVAIGLNFAGLFEVGLGMTRLARFDRPAAPAGAGARSPLGSVFGSGVLAVVVATPCTAPFMGSALGFTLGASLAETLAVFTALGLGMSLPYLLLGWFPGWLRWLPRPGRWMESLRQFLAFPMFATVAWLAWVLGQQAGIDAVLGLGLASVLLALSGWVYGRFVQQVARPSPWPIALALLSLAAALWTAWPAGASDADQAGRLPAGPASSATAGASAESTGGERSGNPTSWEPWSAARVEQLLAAGRPVFVDFTAAWCVTCQVNKKVVLDRAPVVEAMQAQGVARLRADWTRRDPQITAELARRGRSGVPLYLFFPAAGQPPHLLPELLSDEIVLAALRAGKAGGRPDWSGSR